MPRVEHRVDPQQLFTDRERVLLQVLWQEVNILRQAAGLPQRTQAYLRQRVQQLLADDRRGGN